MALYAYGSYIGIWAAGFSSMNLSAPRLDGRRLSRCLRDLNIVIKNVNY